MNPFTLDPRSTALVLIDLQHGVVGMKTAPRSGADVVAQSAKLAAACRARDIPVVLVRVTPSADGRDALAPTTDAPAAASAARPANWATLVPELGQTDSDIVITKRQWGAFHGTELDLQLRRRGVRTLLLGGIATHIGVESTARSAYELGYDQVFIEDAMAAMSEETHAYPLKNVFPRIGRVRSTQQVLDALQAR